MLHDSSRKHILTVTCEFCNGTNIIALNKKCNEVKSGDKEIKTYEADYLCLNCKSQGHVVQTWSRYTPESIQRVKDQLRGEHKCFR